MSPPSAATWQQASASLGEVIGAIGAADFAPRALAALQGAVRAGSWSVYELRPGQAPLLHCSATQAGPDLTRACFAAYARGLYLRDSSFDAVRRGTQPGQPLVTAMHADAAPNRDHREAIYRAHQMLERLSVSVLDEQGGLLAVNLYHHEAQGPFSEAERAGFLALAPLLHQAVRRHLALATQPADVAPAGEARAAPRTSLRIAGLDASAPSGAAHPAVRGALSQAAPDLTPRELDVCERLLRGWSHDGVAADLGLSLATVKTYRARAFARLGLHFRSELFARFGLRGAAGLALADEVAEAGPPTAHRHRH